MKSRYRLVGEFGLFHDKYTERWRIERRDFWGWRTLNTFLNYTEARTVWHGIRTYGTHERIVEEVE